jgi:hypothetical protein
MIWGPVLFLRCVFAGCMQSAWPGNIGIFAGAVGQTIEWVSYGVRLPRRTPKVTGKITRWIDSDGVGAYPEARAFLSP